MDRCADRVACARNRNHNAATYHMIFRAYSSTVEMRRVIWIKVDGIDTHIPSRFSNLIQNFSLCPFHWLAHCNKLTGPLQKV